MHQIESNQVLEMTNEKEKHDDRKQKTDKEEVNIKNERQKSKQLPDVAQTISHAQEFQRRGLSINMGQYHPINMRSQTQFNATKNLPMLINTRYVADPPRMIAKSNDDDQFPLSSKERNEKERKRAQKISKLIRRLESSMIKDGWMVEMKSNYHVLSACKDYIKHLIKIKQEKEEAIQKVKADLIHRAFSEPRSDPESVMSSLTSSIYTSSHSVSDEKAANRKRQCASTDEATKHNAKKSCKEFKNTEALSVMNKETENCGHYNIKEAPTDSQCFSISNEKKDSTEIYLEQCDTSLENRMKVHKNYSKHINTPKTRSEYNSKITRDAETLSSITDTSRQRLEKHQLNYEEVFITSNVPQIIATSAGQIIKYNDSFLKSVGLSGQELRYLTLFDFVQSDQLSSLFEELGKELRRTSSESSQMDPSNERQKEDKQSTHKEEDSIPCSPQNNTISLMKIPCVDFSTNPCRLKKSLKRERVMNKLFLTISLILHDDPRKCLFHCLLNDFSIEKSSAGYISQNICDIPPVSAQ